MRLAPGAPTLTADARVTGRARQPQTGRLSVPRALDQDRNKEDDGRSRVHHHDVPGMAEDNFGQTLRTGLVQALEAVVVQDFEAFDRNGNQEAGYQGPGPRQGVARDQAGGQIAGEPKPNENRVAGNRQERSAEEL